MFSMLKDFLPWILYSSIYLPGSGLFSVAIAITLASIFIFCWKDIKDKFILTIATLIYFSLLLILNLLFHWQWLKTDTWLISNCVLAAIAFGSSLIGKPFTIQYAKRMVPEERWENKLFIQINYILTNVWGVIFLLGALVNYIYGQNTNSISYFILSNIGWVIGAYFSKKFPDYWVKRQTPNSRSV